MRCWCGVRSSKFGVTKKLGEIITKGIVVIDDLRARTQREMVAVEACVVWRRSQSKAMRNLNTEGSGIVYAVHTHAAKGKK